MAAEVKAAGSSLELGAIKQLFDMKTKSVAFIGAVSADGQRFLIASPMGQSSTPLTLVLNWDQEFKKE